MYVSLYVHTYRYVRTLYLYGEILFICIFCFFLSLVPISCDIQTHGRTHGHTHVTLLLLYIYVGSISSFCFRSSSIRTVPYVLANLFLMERISKVSQNTYVRVPYRTVPYLTLPYVQTTPYVQGFRIYQFSTVRYVHRGSNKLRYLVQYSISTVPNHQHNFGIFIE